VVQGASEGASTGIVTTVRDADGGDEMANVFDLLDQEWRRLSRSRAAARELADVCHLAGATSLAEVERYVRGADPADADRVLIALVARAVAGGALAARVLLQLLLPGTRSLARRWWALGDHDERAAAAVLAVYDRIRCYPLARRPGRVAANVLMDAARELRRSVPRGAGMPASDAERGHRPRRASTPADAPLHPALELAEVLSDAVRDQVIDAADAELIARSRIAGDRVADIAARRGSRPRTLWDRRLRAENTLINAYMTSAGAARAQESA
jgi:hypothetical protein